MCGIFAISFKEKTTNYYYLKKIIRLSLSRGLDNIGIVSINNEINIFKDNNPGNFNRIDTLVNKIEKNTKIIFGQCRLVTDGPRFEGKYNQPINNKNIIGTHNGIILNYTRQDYSENIYTKNDSCEFFKDIGKLNLKKFPIEFKKLTSNSKGIINTIFFNKRNNNLYFYTNNGSLFFYKDANCFICASEKKIIENLVGKNKNIKVFKKKNLYNFDYENFALKSKNSIFNRKVNIKVLDESNNRFLKIKNLKRCTKCILPETYPLINFNELGECNYCASYKKQIFLGKGALEKILGNKKNPILYGLSGGRDSSYGLYYLYEKMGYKNIITYTYDWGLTTDIARKNISILCSKYGLENILRSADISQKRSNIRSNIYAWLKSPNLGMVPIFFIGDKPFLYYGSKLKKETGAYKTIHGTGFQCEQMEFKVGYCGINQILKNNVRMSYFSLVNKFKLFFWYVVQFLKNPHYLNQSMLDNVVGFYSSFVHNDQAIHLYNYIEYDEKLINKTLKKIGYLTDKKYGKNQWRVGDGQTAFTNFIYYNLGGFSEFDNYRSNQIREGILSRNKAEKLALLDNQTKLQSIDNFCKTIGCNTEELLTKILNIKTIF